MFVIILILSCYFISSNASDNDKYAPKLGPVLNNQQVDLNLSFQTFCAVQQGAQPLFFEWFKNGQPIKASPGVKWLIETSKQFSSLNIQRIAKEDAGNYSCLVKNIYGSDSINVMLTVKGMLNDNCFAFISMKITILILFVGVLNQSVAQ